MVVYLKTGFDREKVLLGKAVGPADLCIEAYRIFSENESNDCKINKRLPCIPLAKTSQFGFERTPDPSSHFRGSTLKMVPVSSPPCDHENVAIREAVVLPWFSKSIFSNCWSKVVVNPFEFDTSPCILEPDSFS